MTRFSKITHSIEDYLKAIYELAQIASPVSTSALANKLENAPASVTGMLKKLATFDPPLVEYERHHGVTLTGAGEKISIEVIRHHRLLELYLTEALGYSWDEVHAEADRLEHVISEEFEERIANYLGNPSLDPHGEPIPTKEGSMAPPAGMRLSDLDTGQAATIVRVADDNAELLRYLAELGMQPNAGVVITSRAPFDGPVHVEVDGKTHALGHKVTNRVYVALEK